MTIFCNTFFSLHFYKYQYWLWHSTTKKNTSTARTPEMHSQWFRWLSTSNLQSQHSMLYNSQIHSYAASYTFSNTSSPNNISSPDIHSSFISEKTNTQKAASMSLDSSSASSETSMTSDLSSASSKASLKGIIQLPSEIIFNIYSNSVNYIMHCSVKILNVNMVLWSNLSSALPKFCLAFVSTCLGFLSLLLFSSMYQTKTSSLVYLFNACIDIFWLIHSINFYFKI